MLPSEVLSQLSAQGIKPIDISFDPRIEEVWSDCHARQVAYVDHGTTIMVRYKGAESANPPKLDGCEFVCMHAWGFDHGTEWREDWFECPGKGYVSLLPV